jgi:cytochrome P450
VNNRLTFPGESAQLRPFPAYAQLREEQPVYLDPVTGHYILTRYDDVRKILLTPAKFSSRTPFLGNRWAP